MKDEFKPLAEDLLKIPEAKKAKAIEIQNILNRVAEIKLQIELQENLTMRSINEAMTSDGKKAFTNEAMRNAELLRIKTTDPEFKNLNDLLDIETNKLAIAKIEFDYLNDLFSAKKSIVRLETKED